MFISILIELSGLLRVSLFINQVLQKVISGNFRWLFGLILF
jgi:hypothetical protein